MNCVNLLVIQLIVFIVLVTQSACSFKPLGVKKDPYEPVKPSVNHVPRRDNGAIYQQGMTVGLFDRVTARVPGDIVTVVLRENTNASTTSNTNATKDQKVDLRGPTLAGDTVKNKEGVEVLKNKVDAGREFSGQATSAQSSSFSGYITVSVAEVLTNGNLVVRGQKITLLNQSEEFIRFSGIIRPQDIRPDNTVESFRVADVKVAYSGDGALNSANDMGPLAKFFQSSSWPY